MSAEENKTKSIEKLTTENEDFLQNLNLQQMRASVLKKHLKTNTGDDVNEFKENIFKNH